MNDDKLEQFVRNHSKDFNSLEPPVMAWDAIEKELPQPRVNSLRKLWPAMWKVAAAILIFTSAWLINDYMDSQQRYTAGTSKSQSKEIVLPELQDAEAYYTSQINSKQAELAAYAKQNPEIIEDLKKEFLEMDKTKAELKKDLSESNADEKVIEAIILSYRVKLEILDQMLTELRKSKTESKPIETSL